MTLPGELVCHNCSSREIEIFYEVVNVPVHSVLLLRSSKEALNCAKGNINLGFCHRCGFIANVNFDPEKQEFSSRYEGTQAYSSTFQAFHLELAQRLIERYKLHQKKIIEIGCGQGEFLSLLCRLGNNQGVGFDPSYREMGNKQQRKGQIVFIKDFYTEKYAHYKSDFICCKMTLEHIQQPMKFISSIQRAVGSRKEIIVFFQVPDVKRILDELAFWDIYYEHCSYFSRSSLIRLFQNCGFEVIDLLQNYCDQYLMIEAKPSNKGKKFALPQEDDYSELSNSVNYFAQNYQIKFNEWRSRLAKIKHSGARAVIWGAGSKGVSFLTTLKIQDEIQYAVDINPNKKGTYMAGTGHIIVGPEFLLQNRPDVVIVMNPVYYKEIRQQLERMGIASEILVLK